MPDLFWVRDEDQRDDTIDSRTVVVPHGLIEEPRVGEGVDLAAVFRRHYAAIRGCMEPTEAPGLSLVVLDGEGLAAVARLPAGGGELRHAVLGRHSKCDLFLPAEPALSLRQLVVLLLPQEDPEQTPRFRVLDLRAGLDMRDERGQRIDGLEADGPVFLSIGPGLRMLCVPTSPVPWPEGADEAWETFPECLYRPLEAPGGHAVPEGSGRSRDCELSWWGSSTQTIVTQLGPLRPLGRDDRLGEAPWVRFHLEVEPRETALEIGEAVLEQGVLLGRYDRCDRHELLDADPGISRVHLLLSRLDGELWAVDLASTNGLYRDDLPQRATRVEPGDVLGFGTDSLLVRSEEP